MGGYDGWRSDCRRRAGGDHLPMPAPGVRRNAALDLVAGHGDDRDLFCRRRIPVEGGLARLTAFHRKSRGTNSAGQRNPSGVGRKNATGYFGSPHSNLATRRSGFAPSIRDGNPAAPNHHPTLAASGRRRMANSADEHGSPKAKRCAAPRLLGDIDPDG